MSGTKINVGVAVLLRGWRLRLTPGPKAGALALPPLPAPPLVDPLEVLLSRHADLPTPPGEQAAHIESLWRKQSSGGGERKDLRQHVQRDGDRGRRVCEPEQSPDREDDEHHSRSEEH